MIQSSSIIIFELLFSFNVLFNIQFLKRILPEISKLLATPPPNVMFSSVLFPPISYRFGINGVKLFTLPIIYEYPERRVMLSSIVNEAFSQTLISALYKFAFDNVQ